MVGRKKEKGEKKWYLYVSQGNGAVAIEHRCQGASEEHRLVNDEQGLTCVTRKTMPRARRKPVQHTLIGQQPSWATASQGWFFQVPCQDE